MRLAVRPALRTWILAVPLAVLGLGGCSGSSFQGSNSSEANNSEEESPAKKGDGTAKVTDDGLETDDEDQADAPVWINASYLTCTWEDAPSETHLKSRCAVVKGDEEKDLDGMNPRWDVEEDGEEVDADIQEEDDAAVISMAGTTFFHRSISLTLTIDDKDQTVTKAFKDTLPGLSEDAEFKKCLDDGTSANVCLDELESATTQETQEAPIGTWVQAVGQNCTATCTALGKASGTSPSGHSCVSGEIHPEEVIGIINFVEGCGTSCTKNSPSPGATTVGPYCYGPTDKRDDDDTDITVGCFCM